MKGRRKVLILGLVFGFISCNKNGNKESSCSTAKDDIKINLIVNNHTFSAYTHPIDKLKLNAKYVHFPQIVKISSYSNSDNEKVIKN